MKKVILTLACGIFTMAQGFANDTSQGIPTTIDTSKIRYTVGEGANLTAFLLSFDNNERLDNLVWGYRSDAGNVDAATILEEIAAADKRLRVTKDIDGNISEIAFDQDGNGLFDIRDAIGEGVWSISNDHLASDNETPVAAASRGNDILEAPYYFYLPSPDEEGVWLPEAMTVKLSDEGCVLSALVQSQGKGISSVTNWQASSKNTSYSLDRTKIVTPYTQLDQSYNVKPTFVGAAGVTYVRFRPSFTGKGYVESNFMTLTIEAPEVPMTSIAFDQGKITSGLNKVVNYSYSYQPENATYTAVTLASSNTKVATWSASAGLKTTTTSGTATITISSSYDSSVTAACELESQLMKPVTAVSFGPGTENGVITLTPKEMIGLRTIVEPADADITDVNVTLSNNGTAKADYTCSMYKVNYWDVNKTRFQFYELSGHRLTGDNPATLTVTSADGAFTQDIAINVVDPDRTPLENGYVDGTIILNEEWFGHTNGGLNYLTPDNEVIYQAYERENPGMSFGCTSQYGTIWGDMLIVPSKQAVDGGDPLPGGGRLVLANAATLKRLGSLDLLTFDGASGNGRAVAGALPGKIYVTTNNGIYIVNVENPENPVITGRIGGASNGDLYNGQIGDIITAKNHSFAVMQAKGLIIVNVDTDESTMIPDTNIQGVTQSSDGNVWYATIDSAKGCSVFVALNPDTLEEVDRVEMPASIGTVTCGWGAWRSTAFKGSTKTNELWFMTGGGSIAGGGTTYFRYHIGDVTENIQPFFQLNNIKGTTSFGEEVGQMNYGTPMFDARNNQLIVTTSYSGAASGQYRDHWIHLVDGTTAEIKKSITLRPYYWFQALPIFPDKYAAEINVTDLTLDVADGQMEIDLTDLVTDRDNIDANIRLSLVDTPEALNGESQPLCAETTLDGRKLTIVPLNKGVSQLTLAAESNGRIATKTITLTITDNVTGINTITAENGNIACDGRRVELRNLDASEFAIYDTNGREMTRFNVDGDHFVAEFGFPNGIYILRSSNGFTSKIILKK